MRCATFIALLLLAASVYAKSKGCSSSEQDELAEECRLLITEYVEGLAKGENDIGIDPCPGLSGGKLTAQEHNLHELDIPGLEDFCKNTCQCMKPLIESAKAHMGAV